jgi:hypothetical protein
MSLPTLIVAPSKRLVQAIDGKFLSEDIKMRYGENLYRGYPRIVDDVSVPHMATFVLTRAGEAPDRMRSPQKARLASLMGVYFRGEPNRFEESEDAVRVLWWHLHTMSIPAPFTECVCQDSEPEWNGADITGHPLWTINVRMIREE